MQEYSYFTSLCYLAAAQWQNGFTYFWMMVAGKWRKYKAWRGGVQGSYVIKVVFDGVITTAIRAVTATTNNWHKKAANGQAQGTGRNGHDNRCREYGSVGQSRRQ